MKQKGRPSDNPLIVHIADLEDLSEITENVPPETELLAKHFWPGPLTMIFEKKFSGSIWHDRRSGYRCCEDAK